MMLNIIENSYKLYRIEHELKMKAPPNIVNRWKRRMISERLKP